MLYVCPFSVKTSSITSCAKGARNRAPPTRIDAKHLCRPGDLSPSVFFKDQLCSRMSVGPGQERNVDGEAAPPSCLQHLEYEARRQGPWLRQGI